MSWLGWVNTYGLISKNLPHPFDINKSNPLNWYGQIYTEESILFNLPWQVNIKGSKNHQYQWIYTYSWYWWIYLNSISMNLTQWVSMEKSTETSGYWWKCTEEPILMNLSWWANINEYTQKSWYWRIYPKGQYQEIYIVELLLIYKYW